MIRYTLLSAFLVVGLAALYLRRETNVAWRAALLGLLFVWGAASASDHVRLAHEYGTRRPANVFRELALHLEQHGHRYGWADYWTAYHVTFLSDTRVVLTPSDVVRIDRYRQLVEANGLWPFASSGIPAMAERGCDSGISASNRLTVQGSRFRVLVRRAGRVWARRRGESPCD